MELEKLRLFYELVSAGGVRKLAEINGEPIAKISRYLAALEKEIGYVLIERKQGNSGFGLTAQGRVLFENLPTVFGIFDNIRQIMETKPALNAGEISIYTTNSLIEDWLVHMLPEFYLEYPNIRVDLIAHNSLFAQDLKRRIISISPFDTTEDEEVCQLPLLDFNVGLWASKGYLDKHGRPEKVRDLEKHRVIVYAKELTQMTYPTLNWFMKDLNIQHIRPLVINSSIGLIKAAHEGLGIISLSAENLNASGYELERVLPNMDGPKVPMCLTYPRYWKGNKIMEIVESFLVQAFRNRAIKTSRKPQQG